jgi:hypothetical protein
MKKGAKTEQIKAAARRRGLNVLASTIQSDLAEQGTDVSVPLIYKVLRDLKAVKERSPDVDTPSFTSEDLRRAKQFILDIGTPEKAKALIDVIDDFMST